MKLDIRAIKCPAEDSPKKLTAVFIDYESLFISFQKQLSSAPDLFAMIEDVKQHGKIISIKVFADFGKPELDSERNRIRTVTSDIIDCGNESSVNRKDFTDFIMLDHIYKEIIQNPVVEQFVLFTGDGHFSSVATFLKTFMDKVVGCYGVPGTLSNQLKDCCTWVKLIDVIDDEDEMYQMDIIRNFRHVETKNILPTFTKTVEHLVRTYSRNPMKYESVLRNMIDDGFIYRELCNSFADREFMTLRPNWERIEEELMPKLAQSIAV
jgi:hypothetical protein